MSAGVGKPIKPYIYIEGKRLDNAFISATVSSQIGSPATAVIELTPTNTIRYILPRSYVHIFVNDPWSDSTDPVLLFEGEVLGTGFVRNDDGRAFVIHCADVSNYWHHVRQFWMNLSQGGGNFLDNFIRMTTGGAGRIDTVGPFGVKGYMLQRLNLVSGDENKFMESLIGLLDDIGNVSTFYRNARRRLRITDRIITNNAGNVQNLFQLSFFSDWIQQLIEARSSETNLLSVITLLLNIIYHEYVSILAPPYLRTTGIKRDAFGDPVRRAASGKSSLRETETEEKNVIGNFLFKPHIYTLPPPTCNVLFPEMYDGINYQRNFTEETTRMNLVPQVADVGPSPLRLLKYKVFKRPRELDTFYELITSANRIQNRPNNATLGDGQGQSAFVQEYDFLTNEERFKGIVPKLQGLAPAPAILSLSNQGQQGADGKKTGGAPRYLHNVASYSYYMSKFLPRTFAVSGVFNIRPVIGYPLLVMDDSDANLHFVAYLQGITHTLHAKTGPSTQYTTIMPREINEIDLNRPKLDAVTKRFEFETQNGVRVFNFEKMFTKENAPPVPDWFSDDFKTIGGLTSLYKSILGSNVASVEDIRNASLKQSESDAVKALSSIIAEKPTNTLFAGGTTAGEHILDVVMEQYKASKDAGDVFSFINQYTGRAFTTTYQAFHFLRALPKNFKNARKIPVADEEYIGSSGELSGSVFTDIEASPTGETTGNPSSETNFPIYNGKPVPYPFELDIYNQSVSLAKKKNESATSGTVLRTPAPEEQAPTGLGVEGQDAIPVSYPMSEQEVIKARRSIIDLYRIELENKRGFRG